MAKKKDSKKTDKKDTKKEKKGSKKTDAPKKSRIVFLDTETGGLDSSRHSLLTAGFVVVELNTGKVLDRLDLKIKRNEYVVTGKAMEINKIDLGKLNKDKKALEVEPAVGAIIDFLKKNFKKTLPAVPAGHHTPFDLGFLRVLFKEADADLDKFLSFRYLDTMPVLRLLAAIDVVPDSACSLQGAKRHFGVKQKRGAAHTALADAEATVEVARGIIDMLIGDDDNPASEEPDTDDDEQEEEGVGETDDNEEDQEDDDDDDDDEDEEETPDELEGDDDDEEEEEEEEGDDIDDLDDDWDDEEDDEDDD